MKNVPDKKSASWSIEEQFAELHQVTKNSHVILYFPGRAYIVGSPDTHRFMTARFAEGCGERVFSLSYRVAPQDPFPAAWLMFSWVTSILSIHRKEHYTNRSIPQRLSLQEILPGILH